MEGDCLILYLGPQNLKIEQYFLKHNLNYMTYNQPINLEFCQKYHITTIISFGYRYIIENDIVKFYKNKIFNVHISYLPFNRGADPNLWSFIEESPKGVTIHAIDEGIDTGGIYIQEEIEDFNINMTFSETYKILQEKASLLLIKNFDDLLSGRIQFYEQEGKGSYHTTKDKEKYKSCLIKGWDTMIKDFLTCVREKEYENY